MQLHYAPHHFVYCDARLVGSQARTGEAGVAHQDKRSASVAGALAHRASLRRIAKVTEWLAKQPRFQVHFTPTSASWLNMVERFFRDITTERLRSGVFRSVPELIAAIREYIALHNQNPKPFVWTAKAHDILAKVIRANRSLSSKPNEALQ